MKRMPRIATQPRIIALLVVLLTVTLLLAGCGYDKEEAAPTLPPATVISATQPAVALPTAAPPAAQQPTALPMPPQLPAQLTGGGYPNPGLPPGQPGAAAVQPTPVAYPTP